MKLLLRTMIALFCLAGWGLAAMALHVVRLPQGLLGIVPKDHLTLTDTYLDVRPWTGSDVAQHPDFVRRLVAADRADWLAHLTDPKKGDTAGQLIEMLTPAAPAAAAAPLHPKTAVTTGRVK